MKIHIVQKGDTLWTISKKYGVDFDELKKMNAQLSNPDMIMPGMKIKVPTGGGTIKKEMPIASANKPKEMPKAEHPFIQKKEAPMPVAKPAKEVPKVVKEVPKEMPAPIHKPVMPQQLPEIDINNYYTMNLQQLQAQVQQPLPVKEQPAPIQKEEPVQMPVAEEVPEEPQMPVMPVMPQVPVQQNMCPPVFHYCYQMPVMPVCDPCYPMMQPYGFQPQMMPQYPVMQNPAQMSFPQQSMPTAMPGMQMPEGNWELDDWDVGNAYDYESPDNWGDVQEFANPGFQQPMPYPNVNMPMHHHQQPFPVQGMNEGTNDCGCGGTAPMAGYGHPFFQHGQQIMPHMHNQAFAQPFGFQPNPYGMPNPEMSYALPNDFRVGNDEE